MVTDLSISSALNGVSFQLGSSSVSSGPKPRSISSRLYSKFDGVTLVGDGGAGDSPVYTDVDDIDIVDVDEDGVVEQPTLLVDMETFDS